MFAHPTLLPRVNRELFRSGKTFRQFAAEVGHPAGELQEALYYERSCAAELVDDVLSWLSRAPGPCEVVTLPIFSAKDLEALRDRHI